MAQVPVARGALRVTVCDDDDDDDDPFHFSLAGLSLGFCFRQNRLNASNIFRCLKKSLAV